VNLEHLSLYHQSQDKDCPFLTDPRSSLQASEEYKVDYIVISRYNKKKQTTEYLVCWWGYRPKHDSWQSSWDLCNAPEVLKEFKNWELPHTATDPLVLPVLIMVIASYKVDSPSLSLTMRSHTDFKDQTPAHYVGELSYGYTFPGLFHPVLTPPIAHLMRMGHMGIMDILGQWPSFKLITLAPPYSLLAAFVPAFLELVCDIWDDNKQFCVKNECLDALCASWTYAWKQAEENEHSSWFPHSSGKFAIRLMHLINQGLGTCLNCHKLCSQPWSHKQDCCD
jgi:Chromo (CHRromatin Organisation MOdifier) domain